MTVREHAWPAGTPSWVDLSVGDLDAAVAFYGGLFGWEATDLGPEAGGYRMLSKDGHQVAGVGPAMDPGAPAAWLVYFATDDVDETAVHVADAGGRVLAEPMEVLDSGRMAVVADNQGGTFGLWQARAHQGVDLVDEPGALTWVDCHTDTYVTTQTFYAVVFGWTYEERPTPGEVYSSAMRLPDRVKVAGIKELPGALGVDVRPFWLAWFAVDDCDAALARAVELGGSIASPATDSPYGRLATLAGPEGEVVGVVDLARRVGPA